MGANILLLKQSEQHVFKTASLNVFRYFETSKQESLTILCRENVIQAILLRGKQNMPTFV